MARSDSLALIAPACLLIGGLGGALLTSQLGFPTAATQAASNAPAPVARPDGVDRNANLARPTAAAAFPQASAPRPDEAPEPATRREFGAASEEASGETEKPLASAEELGRADSLVAELTAILRSGRIEQALATDQSKVVDRLIDLYLEVGDAGAAYGLLGRVETRPGNWNFVAEALRRAGRTDLADEALAQAIRLALAGDSTGGEMPGNLWQIFQRYQNDTDAWLDELRASSPDVAADILQQQASNGELDSGMRIDLIQSLRESGRVEEALAEVESLLAEGQVNVAAIQELRELNPERAEELLNSLMSSNPSAEIELEYFRVLNSSGRSEEALALILDRAAGGTLPAHLLREAMRTMDADLVGEQVDAWAANAPDNVTVQTEIAQFYTRAGNYEAAADAYLSIYDVAASGNGGNVPLIPEGVAQAAQGAFVSRLDRMTTFAGTDDEYWGDIADSYWRLGQFQAAESCWRRANEIDPGDGEWTNKISAVENGTDPL
ncbi:hypothetical protein [Engelhardtia mirabilis]|uniref:Tetratricopeptide repeat protein n=1 Tax=Engelhardtia mirabilis TaxID=2528011 RepID=A0A518BJM1_9BACT|nr:Tetratricopeptide repeat protein [Planctomycetes bacterium Pla133]QDV01501.1 Tetratricopeptide repeat protein [Planctomycetes bacterium Pla86]